MKDTRPGRSRLVQLPQQGQEPSSEDEEHCFRLRLELDVEHERQVLYKVALVLEALGVLVLVRQWLLTR